MSGGNADLEAMRRIVARSPPRSPFEVFDGQTDVYSHIFALTGARHVMLRRTSKGLRTASDGAGKKATVEYTVDAMKFNDSMDGNNVYKHSFFFSLSIQEDRYLKYIRLNLSGVPQSVFFIFPESTET